MVDVSAKPDTARDAVAVGTVTMRPETLALILQGKVPKGDVFTVARIAGVNAAKHTWEADPARPPDTPLPVTVDFETDPPSGTVTITAAARTMAKTGVEMEALTAVSLAALTIYDMCKAVEPRHERQRRAPRRETRRRPRRLRSALRLDAPVV